MMQLCSLVCIVCLWWTSSCFGARVDAPNASSRNFPTRLYPPLTHTREGGESKAATGLAKLKDALAEDSHQTGVLLDPEDNFGSSKATTTTTTHIDNVNSVFRETKPAAAAAATAEVVLGRRIKRSYAPVEETYSPASRRYRRLITWKRRPWGDAVVKRIDDENDDYFSAMTPQEKSSFQDSGSLIYLVSSDNNQNNNNNKNINSLQKSEPMGSGDKKDCPETFSSADSSPFQGGAYSDAPVSDSGKEQFESDVLLSHEQPVKRVDRSLPLSTSDMLASAGQNIARNFMKRRRGGRMYDVPQIGEFNFNNCTETI